MWRLEVGVEKGLSVSVAVDSSQSASTPRLPSVSWTRSQNRSPFLIKQGISFYFGEILSSSPRGTQSVNVALFLLFLP